MKSSFDAGLIPSDQVKAAAWRPADFSKAPSTDLQTDIQTIQNIFQADENLIESLKLQKGLVKSPAKGMIPSWKPCELTYKAFNTPILEKAIFPNDAAVDQNAQAAHSSHGSPDRNQPELLTAETQRKVQEILAQATQTAEEMARKGYLDGLNNAKAELASSFEAADNLLSQLQDFEKEILAQSESQVLGLIRSMAKTMFSEGMVLDEKTLHETFTEALENARSLGVLKIYLNPRDTLNLNPDWREDQAYISGQKMQFIPSEDILPGGCYVVGELGSVDARIDSKLNSILNVLTRRVEVE